MGIGFDEFVHRLDDAVRSVGGAVDRFAESTRDASWSAGDRRAAMTLVPPMNVSVALERPGAAPTTTWYPVDAALVPVVSKRIAGFLSES